jgi:chemotaxis protein CheX
MTELNHEVADAVGELVNMISGQARRELEVLGRLFHAAIPTVISGQGHCVTHYTDGPKIAIPFTTEGGSFIIEVCLES